MYYKEEIQITKDDMVIIEKLGELLCLSKIDNYFYVHDQDLFVQLKVFTDKFEEAYEKGFGRYFSDKHYYRWVRSNVINKFTGLLESLFEGLLEQFKEDNNANGVLTYKNCKAYRTYNVVTQSEQQAETTQEVTSRILTLEEAKRYENDGMLEFEDNLIQTMQCFHIKTTESADKVDSKKKKKLIEEIRVLVYQKMCSLLTKNLKRANCVEEIQYRLMLGTLIGVVNKGFTPRWKKENYDSFEVAKQVRVNMRSEFNYFEALYKDLVHYKKSLIKMDF